jgi:hypothetical protein
MEEVELTIKQNGDFKNIYLNEKETIEVPGVGKITMPKLREDRYIIVEKQFDMPREVTGGKFTNPDGSPKTSYSYRVKYLEEDVSFFLNKKKEADALNVLGNVGSKIKITAELSDSLHIWFY